MKLIIKSIIWNIRKQKQPIRTTKRKKNPEDEDSINSLWNNSKRSNIHLIGVPEGEEKSKKMGTYLKK